MEGLRKLLDWEWYSDTGMVRLLVHLLLKANTEDGRLKGLTIKRGQLVTTLRDLQNETNLSVWTLRRCLSRMVSSRVIRKDAAGIKTIITICNFDDYQEQTAETSQGCRRVSHRVSRRVDAGITTCKFDDYQEQPTETPQGSPQGSPQGLEKQEKKEKNQKNKKEEKENNSLVDGARAREKVWFDEFLNSTIQIQAVCMQTGVTEEDFRARAREVWAGWELTGVTHSDATDFKTHLLSTIRIKIQQTTNKQNNNGRNTNTASDSAGNESGENPLLRAKIHRAHAGR